MKKHTLLKSESLKVGGSIFAELQVKTPSKFGDAEISIWINGGRAYRFKTTHEQAQKLTFLTKEEKSVIAAILARKVASVMEAGITEILDEIEG